MLVRGIHRPRDGLQPQVCGKVHDEVHALVRRTLLPVDEMSSQKEGATIIVLWEIWPKKEDTYPKRVIDTHKLEKITDRIQKSATDFIFTNTNINNKDY